MSGSTCRCISEVFVGRKVISMFYSSAILKVHSVILYYSLLSCLDLYVLLFLLVFKHWLLPYFLPPTLLGEGRTSCPAIVFLSSTHI